MQTGARLRLFLRDLWQTSVVSLVLLALFNSAIWAPAQELHAKYVQANSRALMPPASAPAAAISPPKDVAREVAAVQPSKVSPPVVKTAAAAHAQRLEPKDFSSALQVPVKFIENKGQWDSRVRFQVRAGNKTLWLTDTGIVFDNLQVLPQASEAKENNALPASRSKMPEFERLVFNEDLVNSNPSSYVEGIDPQPGVYNYLQSSDRSQWHTGVRSYGGVVYHDMWKGVDLRLLSKGNDIEQEFLVHPGADPSPLHVEYRGIDGLKVADDGSLVIATKFGELRESKPVFYQEIAGNRQTLDGQFKLTSDHAYTFEIRGNSSEYALLIDPTLLYSSYLGGTKADLANGIAVDSTGAAFLAGMTLSTDFPVTPGAFTGPNPGSGNWAVFLSKVSPLGDKLLFSTTLGPGSAWGGVAVDAQGNPYITGNTSSDGTAGKQFPSTPNAYSDCGGHGYPVTTTFVAKLSPAGDSLIYSTCWGSGGANAIALDGTGKAYIVGTTGYIPTTANAYRQTIPPHGVGTFLSVIDTNASGQASLFYSTYFGRFNPGDTFDFDQGLSIAVDAFGKAYITGLTFGNGYPTTAGAFQTTYYGSYYCNGRGQLTYECTNAFVAKIDPTAATGPQSLIYSTLLGGSNATAGWGIAVDQMGNAYVTGQANIWGNGSVPFPTTTGAFQSNGFADSAFVTKLNAGGSGLVYSTMLGASPSGGGENGQRVAVDVTGAAYVAGKAGLNFPVTPDAFQQQERGEGDVFLTKFDPTGSSLTYSSYLGGSHGDNPYGIAIDAVGDAYVAGVTLSLDFPTTTFAFQPTPKGGSALNLCEGPNCDGFVTKFPLGGIRVLQVLPSSGGNRATLLLRSSGEGSTLAYR